MRSGLFVVVLGLTACKGDPFRPDAQIDAPDVDAAGPAWFSPKPGDVKNWDIQLAAPYDFTTPRAMMIVNLWDVVPTPTTITYADDTVPVTVPAGSQAGAIAMLKSQRTTVICHVGLGAVNLADPDAMKIPGYAATLPDRPTPVAADSAIGWRTPAGANERFVDFRVAGAAKVLKKRVSLAKQIGCDGVLAYRNDGAQFPADVGFLPITGEQQVTWITDVAKTAHEEMISIGGRGGHTAAYVDQLTDDYDFLVAERCAEIPDCGTAKPFISARRAVFALDYDVQEDGTPNVTATTCTRWAIDQVDGIVKKATLDGTFRDTCG
ncbi:MAG TPA: endo alpha-1,4 polygalactosaminidase [Kofleriaceae bacterium]|nr:endo alpha-1,4 polygalactosaminidase [Kofleriaceae bacterium]